MTRPKPCTMLLTLLLITVSTRAYASDDRKRVSVTGNAVYMLISVYQLQAEVAVAPNVGAAVRAGHGTANQLPGDPRVATEFGAQIAYYITGEFSRGVQLGLDSRYVRFEGDSKLMGLGEGVALGPFLGYKRVFSAGLTLEGQLGAQLALGESDKRVLPYLGLFAGWSF